MPNDGVSRHLPLKPREEQAIDFEQELLLLTDLGSLVEQDRDVMKIAQLRGAFDLLQPIEVKGHEIVVQSGIENERSRLLQSGSRQRDVSGYLFPRMAGNNLVDCGKA